MTRQALCLALFLGFGGTAEAQTPAKATAVGSPARTIMRLQDYGVVEVELDFAPSISVLNVRYRLLNMASEAIVALDRADWFTVVQNQQSLGDIAVPSQTLSDEGDLVVAHKSGPLPDPFSEVPPEMNMAVLVAPGGVLNGHFTYSPWGLQNGPVRRVRWCLGTMVFDKQVLGSPVQTSLGQVWRASYSTAEMQHISCTAWYDVSRRDFEA